MADATTEVLTGGREIVDEGEIIRGYFTSFDDLKLHFVRWTSPDAEAATGPVVLLVHGYAEHVERYDELCRYLVSDGLPVVGFDVRGHGRSDGPRGFVERFADYIHDVWMLLSKVKARYPGRPVILLGHSNGGLIAIRFVQSHADSVAAVILSSPALRLALQVPVWKSAASGLLSKLLPKMGIPGELTGSDVTRDSDLAERYDSDPMVFKIATPRYFTELMDAQQKAFARSREVTLPILCMQGGDDKVIAADAVAEWMESLENEDSTFARLDGQYHEIFNEPERRETFDRVRTWIHDRFGSNDAVSDDA